MTQKQLYLQTLEEMRLLECRIHCLEQCFLVVSDPETVDAVNLQLLALQKQKKGLFADLRALYDKK